MKMVMTREELENLKTRVDEFGYPLISFTLDSEDRYRYSKAVLKRTFFGCKCVGYNSIPIEIKEE